MGQLGRRPPAASATTAKFALGDERTRHHRRRPRRRAGLRRDRAGRGPGPHARRLLQGPGEVGARRSRCIDGVRYSIPGDYATVEADGTITPARPWLGVHQHRRREGLPRGGRGGRSRRTPAVRDAVVVGVPDEKFGEAIAAVVEPAPGVAVDEAELIAHVKARLAALQGAQARASWSTPSAGPPTARSTTSACAARRWTASASPDPPQFRASRKDVSGPRSPCSMVVGVRGGGGPPRSS